MSGWIWLIILIVSNVLFFAFGCYEGYKAGHQDATLRADDILTSSLNRRS